MTQMELEKYTDPLDIASRNEQIATADSIREVRKNAMPQQLQKKRVVDGVAEFYFEVTECKECGNDIGEERLKVAIKNLYCIECATAQEGKRK